MRGYSSIEGLSAPSVVFVDSEEVDPSDLVIVKQLRQRGFLIAYIDCADYLEKPWDLLNQIGLQFDLTNRPYDGTKRIGLIRWLDDMIGLSRDCPGAVIVLDNAYTLWDAHRKILTDLIEVFLLQIDNWSEKNKPCQLCLQMSPSTLVKTMFAI